MQVYFFPAYVEVCPAFLQAEPALTAASELRGSKREITRAKAIPDLFMMQVSLA
jgi:hypothetical protein